MPQPANGQDPADEDESDAPPRRSSGAPGWLIAVLAVVLVVGLVCVGSVTMFVMIITSAIKTEKVTRVKVELQTASRMVQGYEQEHGAYPTTLKDLQLNANGITPYDQRDPKMAPLIYLQPDANSLPTDILAHTSRTGPLPILAVQVDGTPVEFKTVNEFDLALTAQHARAPAPQLPSPPAPIPAPDGQY